MNNLPIAPDQTETIETARSAAAAPHPSRRARGTMIMIVLLVTGVVVVTGAAIHQARRSEVVGTIGDRVITAATGQSPSGSGGAADGVIGDRVVDVTDTDEPAIAKLDPDLLTALRAATRDAKADGIRILVTSGWRSRDYQQSLLDRAITTYGSRAEALRWVSTPEKSSHVSGDAIDVGATDAAYWVMQHGVDYGLCQTYNNEIWHYELLTDPDGGCPTPELDALG